MSISNAKDVKFLGMWLDENLSWSNHINKLILKISRNSNLIKYNKNNMPKETKDLNISFPHRQPYSVWHHLMGKQCFHSPNKESPKNPRHNCVKYIKHKQTKHDLEKPLKILSTRVNDCPGQLQIWIQIDALITT